ncbi:MoaD/ThiS family protein [Yoonia sp. GPGPB17]|uniref:MoaD/ThiS family protein n=1 Tax=Yoonia sp. GPGPB17 TaxID=3026147 RepID=UPI0030ECA6A5
MKLWGSLRALADGEEWVEVEVKQLHGVARSTGSQTSWVGAANQAGVSLALDGVIYREAWFTKIGPENEVVLMPYMVGG